MKRTIEIVLVVLLLVAIAVSYYFEQIKKPALLSREQVITSYCENDGINQNIYARNTVTSGQLNKIDRLSNVESDFCESENGDNWKSGGQLFERSCKGDVLIEERYTCGYGNICQDGRCTRK